MIIIVPYHLIHQILFNLYSKFQMKFFLLNMLNFKFAKLKRVYMHTLRYFISSRPLSTCTYTYMSFFFLSNTPAHSLSFSLHKNTPYHVYKHTLPLLHIHVHILTYTQSHTFIYFSSNMDTHTYTIAHNFSRIEEKGADFDGNCRKL